MERRPRSTVRLRRPVGGGRNLGDPIDPDHIGAHIGESQAAVRKGTKARQFENANVAEWSGHALPHHPLACGAECRWPAAARS